MRMSSEKQMLTTDTIAIEISGSDTCELKLDAELPLPMSRCSGHALKDVGEDEDQIRHGNETTSSVGKHHYA